MAASGLRGQSPGPVVRGDALQQSPVPRHAEQAPEGGAGGAQVGQRLEQRHHALREAVLRHASLLAGHLRGDGIVIEGRR